MREGSALLTLALGKAASEFWSGKNGLRLYFRTPHPNSLPRYSLRGGGERTVKSACCVAKWESEASIVQIRYLKAGRRPKEGEMNHTPWIDVRKRVGGLLDE